MDTSAHQPPVASENPERAVDALLVDGQPDWDAIEFDVLCSRCGYNLRLLPQPRCPECGLTFDWRAVLDATAWRSDFLFEHHWRTKPIRSWAKTVWRSLRPFRFWQQVSIHDHIRPGPLWFLLLTSIVWFMITLHGMAWLGWVVLEVVASHLVPAGWASSALLIRMTETLDFTARAPLIQGTDYFLWLAIFLLSVLAALALLCSLRQTLGRCRVRTVQILRVVAYMSTPSFIWLGVVLLTLMIVVDLIPTPVIGPFAIVFPLFMIACIAGCPAYFFVAGLKRYLHLPRPTLLGAVASFVGFLFSYTLLIFINLVRMGGWP